MNTYLKIVSFLLLTLKIAIIGQECNTSVIKDASYYVWQEVLQPTNPENFHQINIPFKLGDFPQGQTYYYTIHYYTFDGDVLATINFSSSYHFDPNSNFICNWRLRNEFLRKKIDHLARKPQPQYYKIIYDNKYDDYRVYFYDKNDNLIYHCWYSTFAFEKTPTGVDFNIVQDRSMMTQKEKESFLAYKFVIPNASYYIRKVVKEPSEIHGGKKVTTAFKEIATYYTFDGNYLAEITFNFYSKERLGKKLDPKARRPQPAYYKIVYHTGLKSMGYWIYFYDKNNNQLDSRRYDPEKKLIKNYFSDNNGKDYEFPTNDPHVSFNSLYPNFWLDLSIAQDRTPQEKRTSLKKIIQDIFFS